MKISTMKYFIFCGMMAFPFALFGQLKTKEKKEKSLRHQISVEFGFHYSKVFNAKRVEYSSEPCCTNCACNEEVSFLVNSTSGVQFGFGYDFFCNRIPFYFHTGIVYYNHTQAAEGIKDSVMKYSSYNFNPAYRINITNNNIEIPVLLGYKANKILLAFGLNYIYGFRESYKYTYIDESSYTAKYDFSTSVSRRVYYSFMCSYQIILKEKYLVPYIGLSKNFKNNYDFQMGLAIPILSKYGYKKN